MLAIVKGVKVYLPINFRMTEKITTLSVTGDDGAFVNADADQEALSLYGVGVSGETMSITPTNNTTGVGGEISRFKVGSVEYALKDQSARELIATLHADDGDTNASELEKRMAEMESKMDALLYKAIEITSFTNSVGTRIYGETVSSVTLTWAINKTPVTLTLDGEPLEPAATGEQAVSGLSITMSTPKTWTLVATDAKGNTATATTGVSFCNGIYYGAAAEPAVYDSAFVRGLTERLSASKVSFDFNAGAGQYAYYCLPSRLGGCTFSIGGFTGGFSLVDTISFTNRAGYPESYYIYKSDYPNLGARSVTVS